jgi:hypothetical protein
MRRCALLALVLLAGCALPFRVRQPYARTGSHVTWKKVVDKREPTWLIAADQSSCTVSRDKFDHTGLGDVVLCAWHSE